MANMAYCRMRNTLRDLVDVEEHLSDDVEDMSPEEQEARQEIIDLCGRIAREHQSDEARQKRWNHMLDVAFTIETVHQDWANVPAQELIEALQKRVDFLRLNPGEVLEAFGFSDSHEVES